MNRGWGLFLIMLGGLLVVLGVLAWGGLLGWFGKLPGDIRIERGSTRIYFPLVSMLLLSIAFSILSYLLRRWL